MPWTFVAVDRVVFDGPNGYLEDPVWVNPDYLVAVSGIRGDGPAQARVEIAHGASFESPLTVDEILALLDRAERRAGSDI